MRSSHSARAVIVATVALAGLAGSTAPAAAQTQTACSTDAFCYCVDTGLIDQINKQVASIRALIADQKAQGKAVGYLSIPLSTLAGSYFGVNAKVAAETRSRMEKRLGAHAVWLTDPGGPLFSLPANASGADYMLMWTQVLEGRDGLGAFDFAYFVGPSDFARHFGFKPGDSGVMEKLEAYYDELAETDPGFKAVDRRAFRDYYALRASVAYSYGSHDEWNIVRKINERRRAADPKSGITNQMGIFFDGRPVAPGLFETAVAPGDAGSCAK